MRESKTLKRVVVFAAVCAGIKSVLAWLPDAIVIPCFCRVPAEVAAHYYGVPLDREALAFMAKGVTLAVTRACAATDFFTLIATTALTAWILRRGRRMRLLLALPLAWILTLAVNSFRIIALVPVETVFPKAHAPIVHMFVGVAFFLPVFAVVWHCLLGEVHDEK